MHNLRALVSTSLVLTAFFSSHLTAEEPGSATFNSLCVACHTIGGGRLVGPDLDGVTTKRSEEWLVEFIKSSQSMIQAGDPDAVAVFEEYSSMIMPDTLADDQEIRAVVAYMASQSTDSTLAAAPPAAEPRTADTGDARPEEQASPEMIELGQNLFQGTVRFENRGPTCNACHDVTHDAVIGGGILAAELDTVFSRMSAAGVEAILGRPPFPVMQAAYADQALTEREVKALSAFLQSLDEEELTRQPRDYGVGLFTSGVVGTALIYGVCGLVWRGRRKSSVNQDIYDRQVKSS